MEQSRTTQDDVLFGYLAFYNTDRVHHGRLTRGRKPADIIYGARKMEPR